MCMRVQCPYLLLAICMGRSMLLLTSNHPTKVSEHMQTQILSVTGFENRYDFILKSPNASMNLSFKIFSYTYILPFYWNLRSLLFFFWLSKFSLEFDNPERPECNNLLSIYQLVTGRTKEVIIYASSASPGKKRSMRPPSSPLSLSLSLTQFSVVWPPATLML